MKLNVIIKEEIGGFITEYGKYADDEIVDLNKINLQEEYDRLNLLLFDNQLPKVPLVLMKMRPLGKVQALINRYTREIIVKNLAISTFYKLPYREFLNTFAHEMIHVKQFLIFKENGNHGFSFEREARRINGMGYGFKITATHEGEINVSDNVRQKDLIAIIIHMNKQYSVTVTTPEVYNKESDHLFNLMEKFVNQGRLSDLEITVVKSKNPELQRYRISRTFARGFTSSPLSDAVLEQLLNDDIIKELRIKRGSSVVVSEEIQSPKNSSEWELVEII